MMNRFALIGSLTLALMSFGAGSTRADATVEATAEMDEMDLLYDFTTADAHRATEPSSPYEGGRFFSRFVSADLPAGDSSIDFLFRGPSAAGNPLDFLHPSHAVAHAGRFAEWSFQDVFADISSGGITQASTSDEQPGPKAAGSGFRRRRGGPSRQWTTDGESVPESSVFVLLALGGVCLLAWAAEARGTKRAATA
ncbi:MAG TPA: hypothetical protein VMY42_16110, partial [Thermoguttaceae bacterium]|nr:hypothetical protein [Thermoguttaceae bacterium]